MYDPHDYDGEDFERELRDDAERYAAQVKKEDEQEDLEFGITSASRIAARALIAAMLQEAYDQRTNPVYAIARKVAA